MRYHLLTSQLSLVKLTMDISLCNYDKKTRLALVFCQPLWGERRGAKCGDSMVGTGCMS